MWPTKAGSYKIEQCIGIGNYGLVWRATCFDYESPRHNEEVAIKMINMEKFNYEHTMDDLRREIIIINKCNHRNILKYLVSFLNDKELWLVLPLIECGSLHNVLSTPNQDKDPDNVKIAKKVLD